MSVAVPAGASNGDFHNIQPATTSRPSVTAQLTRQVFARFPRQSVKSSDMNTIAKRTLQTVMEDATIPKDEQQTRAFKVMKSLFAQESISYPDSAIQYAITQAVGEITKKPVNSGSGCCVVM